VCWDERGAWEGACTSVEHPGVHSPRVRPPGQPATIAHLTAWRKNSATQYDSVSRSSLVTRCVVAPVDSTTSSSWSALCGGCSPRSAALSCQCASRSPYLHRGGGQWEDVEGAEAGQRNDHATQLSHVQAGGRQAALRCPDPLMGAHLRMGEVNCT
jgi:hypothetical protein